jgi:Fe-S-cluster containining protein
MQCRVGCGACCTAPSISSPIPSRDGTAARPKAAGERCTQLDHDGRCALFGSPLRPRVCTALRPEPAMCGSTTRDAVVWLRRLERSTRPAP